VNISDDDVKAAERGLMVNLLTALSDKRVIGAVVAAVIALCTFVVFWVEQRTPMTMSVDNDPCCAVQKAAEGKGTVATNSIAKVMWLGCALSACKPTPAPTPIPTPVPTATVVVDAGPPPAPAATNPFVQPTCNPPTLMGPNPQRLDEIRRSLKPRHKVTTFGLFRGVDTTAVSSVGWLSNNPFAGNQGRVGACEAFTQLDIACAKPRTLSFATQALLNTAGLNAYKWITANDDVPGSWPQEDTGSDSLSGCKWLVQNGFAKGCQVLNGMAAIKVAIQSGPVIAGMNWLDGMMTPDRCGNMSLTGPVDGGHAEGLFGYNVPTDTWLVQNHWDALPDHWGVCIGTHCSYHLLTSAQLFSPDLDADFVQPVQ